MMQKLNRLLTASLLILSGLALVLWIHIWPHLTFEQFDYHKELVLSFVEHHYWRSVFIYIALYIIDLVFALPTAAFFNFVGGFLFGLFPGFLYVLISAMLGGMIIFLGVRYFLRDYLHEKCAQELKSFNREMHHYGAYYILMLRIMPFIPSFIVNVCAGLSRVSFFTFMWATFIGLLPGSFIYVFAGKELQTIHSVFDILTWRIIVSLILLGLLVIVPVFMRRKKFN